MVWIKVLAGLACMFIASGEMHSGAMSYEWTNELRVDYKRRAESPGFQSPPDIAGVKHQRLQRRSTSTLNIICISQDTGSSFQAGLLRPGR